MQLIFPHFLSFFMKIFFYLLYHPFAWAYDTVADIVSIGRWQKWINYISAYVQGSEVLELGHGPGHLQISLVLRGLTAFGLDASAQMGNLARRNFAHRFPGQDSAYPRLVRGRAEKLPFLSGQFETVVATFPTEYIFRSETLVEIHRVLHSSGKLVILLSAKITGRSLLDRLAFLLFRVTGQVLPDETDPALLLIPFHEAGFSTWVEWVNTPDGQLLFIQAVKPANK
jgi:ubiquinone/menaquinone biosynthesis C-methylase UbiE